MAPKLLIVMMTLFLFCTGCTSTSYEVAVHAQGFSTANMKNKKVFILQPFSSQAASLDQPSGGDALGAAVKELFGKTGLSKITFPDDGIIELGKLGKLGEYQTLQSVSSLSGKIDSAGLQALAGALFAQGYEYVIVGMMRSDGAGRLPEYRSGQGLDRSIEQVSPNVEADVAVYIISANPEEGLVFAAHARHALNDDYGRTGPARALAKAYKKAFSICLKAVRARDAQDTSATGSGYADDRPYGD